MKFARPFIRLFGLAAVLLTPTACDLGGVDPEKQGPFIVTYDRPFAETIVRQPIETDLPEEEGARDLRIGELVFSTGAVATTAPFPHNEFDPVYILSDLRIENQSSSPVSLLMPLELGCPFVVEVYGTPERTGEPLSTMTCTPSDGPFGPKSGERSIAPGESLELQSFPDVRPLTEDGRYYLLARPIIDGDTLDVPAGSVDYYRTSPDLVYHIRMALEDAPGTDSLHIWLELENVGADTAFIAWPCFSVDVFAFADESRLGEPVFDWQDSPLPVGGCLEGERNDHTGGAGEIALLPGERVAPIQLKASFDTRYVFYQAGEPGLYHFQMRFEQGRIITRTFQFDLGSVTIDEVA